MSQLYMVYIGKFFEEHASRKILVIYFKQERERGNSFSNKVNNNASLN